MTQYTILGRLRLLAALNDGEAMRALPHCHAAMEQLMARLKPGCNKNDPRLDQAGAALAFCMLLLAEDQKDDVESFKAGDITVTKRKGECLQKAEQLKAEALENARELLRDTGFYARSAPFCGKRN